MSRTLCATLLLTAVLLTFSIAVCSLQANVQQANVAQLARQQKSLQDQLANTAASGKQQQQSTSAINAPVNSSLNAATQVANAKQSARSSTRGGRMLDLDLLAGDIDKNESLTRGRSVSGARQSRILNEDLSLDVSQLEAASNPTNIADNNNNNANNNNNKLAARSKSAKQNKKKLSIQGFIPIVSMNGGSNSESESESESNNNEDSIDQSSISSDNQANNFNNAQEQFVSSYGGKTSLGHASFGVQPDDTSADVNSNARARKLNQGQLMNSLIGHPSKLMSNFMNGQQSQQHQSFAPNHQYQNGQRAPLIQAPTNLPQLATNTEFGSECICVPFYQCKSGFLSESQLSKSQLNQILYTERNNVINQSGQTPRTSAQVSDNAKQQQQQQFVANSEFSMASSQIQPSVNTDVNINDANAQATATTTTTDQQQLNEAIYEQIRKTIESGNLDNLTPTQLAQLQQQEGFSQAALNQYLEARSKSSASNSSSVDDVEGRSLLGQLPSLARRSAGVCGVLRTCCKIPPHLLAQQQAQASMMHAQHQNLHHHQHQRPNHNSLLGSNGMTSHIQQQPQLAHMQSVRAGNQIGYQGQQIEVPLGYNQNQNQAYQTQHQHQPVMNQFVSSSHHQPKLNDESYLTAQSQALTAQSQFNGPRGNFMEGRCGVRLATGISGRVQNQQVADNSAEFGEFPSQVAILKRLGSSESLFVCSAVLISNQWIATAAHCVRKYSVNELKVRLGEWNVQSDDEFYPFVERNLRDVIVHPEFQPSNLINDIALLRMDTPLGDASQYPHIAPACLPRASELFDNQRCWVAGWGKDAFGQRGSFQSVLRKVDLPVLPRQTCEAALRSTKLGPYFRLHQSAVCAGGEPGKDACEGDGGSGLYCVDNGVIKAVGLVSWGLSCGQAGVPGVYTSLKHFSGWIENVVANSGEENVFGNSLDLTGLISERSKEGNSNSTNVAQQQQQQQQQNQLFGLPSTAKNSTTTTNAVTRV